MNPIILLISTCISLIGLQVCLPKDDWEKLDDASWTQSPILKIFYGLVQIIGVIFVLGSIGYLTFFEHWWYFLIYIGAVAIARLIAIVFMSFIDSFFVRRIIGTTLVLVGVIVLVIILCNN